MNGSHLNRFSTLLLFIAVSSAVFAACSEPPPAVEFSAQKLFPLAPEMQATYHEIGEEILGEVISPRLEEGNTVYQYTVNALLYCQKGRSGDQEVRFAPIGLELNLPSLPGQWRAGETKPALNGSPIYAEFVPLYERLGGGKQVGMPLSGLRYNPRQRRYEQYFEGVGMYRAEGDPPGKVKLLAYGAWKCGDACLYPVLPQAEVTPPPPLDQRLLPLVEKLGEDFTGFALSPPIRTEDGREIVLFENVAIELAAEAENPPHLSPLPQKLGILPQGLVAKEEDETKIFLSLEGDKGHHVWRAFMDYVDSHGGIELIGLPISEPQAWEKGSVRQCFENACLIEDNQLEGIYRIRPSPLGFEYASLYWSDLMATEKQEGSPADAARQTPTQLSELDQDVTLEIIEGRPFVDQQTAQEVGIIIRFGDHPAENIRPTLYLSFADGKSFEFEMPPTNTQGKSSFTIPPTQAPNGTLVDYRICISTPSGVEICARDDYLIWSP